MFKFGTSDRKKSLKVKPLKPTTKVVDAFDSFNQKEELYITSILFSCREEFLLENRLYPEVNFDCKEKSEYTYKVNDIYCEISFVDGFRFSCRCAEGVLKFYDIMNESYVSLSSTGKFICTGGPSSLVELRNHIRHKVPIFGNFATGIDEKGIRCIFNNAYTALFLNDGDFIAKPISGSHRVVDDYELKGGSKLWYFSNNTVRWC